MTRLGFIFTIMLAVLELAGLLHIGWLAVASPLLVCFAIDVVTALLFLIAALSIGGRR